MGDKKYVCMHISFDGYLSAILLLLCCRLGAAAAALVVGVEVLFSISFHFILFSFSGF